jgi:hypothetical protein
LKAAIFKLAVDELAILHFRAEKNTGLESHINESGEREERT